MTLDVSTTSPTSQAVSAPSANSSAGVRSQKSSTESFKDEMDKVSEAKKEVEKASDSKSADDGKKIEDKKTSDKQYENKESSQKRSDDNNLDQNIQFGSVSVDEQKALMSLKNANSVLVDNIWQMMNADIDTKFSWMITFGENSGLSSLKMSATDAEFFINLTKNENVNLAGITAQAQNLLNSGVEFEQVQKSSLVSKALLDALNNAREKNMPVRIDFDKDIAVILRVNREGAISAHFIPGDKAVEQYLKNNIEMLKNRFDENELPYTDLSYSHSSKEQNQKRRNEKQQGD